MQLKAFFLNILEGKYLIFKCKIDNYHMFLIVCSLKDGGWLGGGKVSCILRYQGLQLGKACYPCSR